MLPSYYSTAVSERAILSAQALSIWVTPVMRHPEGRPAYSWTTTRVPLLAKFQKNSASE